MKKLLSLILALSLIISVAPMSFAIHKEEAVPAVDENFSAKPGIHFNFSAASWGEKEDIASETIEINDENPTPEWATTNTDPWRIAGRNNITNYRITSSMPDTTSYPNSAENSLYWKVTNTLTGLSSTANRSPASTIALAVYINETGTFTPSVTYEHDGAYTTQYFYLAPKSAYGSRTNGYTFNYSTAGEPHLTNVAPMKYCFNGPESSYANKRDPNLTFIGFRRAKIGTNESVTTPTNTATFDPIEIPEPGFYYLYIGTFKYSDDPKTEATDGGFHINIHSFNLKPVIKEFDGDVSDDFTAREDEINKPLNSASIAAYTVCGNETPVSLTAPSVTYGETCELEAPATKEGEDGKTYNFLYWARGLESSSNRKIVSTENKLNYRPHEGVNYLIAVYEEEDASKVEFYNGNGELMTDVTLDNGNLPELPSMAGYDESTGWKRQGDDTVYEASAPAPVDGSKVFVAQYGEPVQNITITVDGGYGSGNYAYGDTVTCKSYDVNFSYWEKTVNGVSEVVSLEKTYTFNAWEDCTVTAVCNGAVNFDGLARKILLGTFKVGNQTAVMAEFIGFDGAKEKGIMFGTKKIAMTTDYAQFTVTNDTTADITVTGYAIVDEAGTTVKYTDGSISVPGVTSAE